MWEWLEKPPSVYPLFGILRMLSIFPLVLLPLLPRLLSSLPLSASGVLGILGIVCSPSLSSQLSRSSPHTLLTSLLLLLCDESFFFFGFSPQLSFALSFPSSCLLRQQFFFAYFFSLNIPVVVGNNKKSSMAAFLNIKLHARTIFCLSGVAQINTCRVWLLGLRGTTFTKCPRAHLKDRLPPLVLIRLLQGLN